MDADARLTNREPVEIHQYFQGKGITALAWNHEQKWLLSAGGDARLHIKDMGVEDGKEVWSHSFSTLVCPVPGLLISGPSNSCHFSKS